MPVLDFASYMEIIRRYLGEYNYPTQLSSLYELFEDCLEDPAMEDYDFDEGQASKWLSGKSRLSPRITGYYLLGDNRADLTYRLGKILIDMYDSNMACNDLSDLITSDLTISETKKRELLARYPCWNQDDMEDFFTDVLLFVMKRKQVRKESSQNALVPAGGTSPYIEDLVIGCKVPRPCRHFTGREPELDDLHELIIREGTVFLQGIAGIGKSELAKAYAKNHRKDYVNILYIMWSGDLENDIAELDFMDDREEDDKSERFRKHNRLLKAMREDSLLIIDNYNPEAGSDHILPIIRKYRCRVLITTRNNFRNDPGYVLEEMDDDKLFELAELIYPEASEHRWTIESVIEYVHNHTMAAELAFRLMETGYLEPEEILQRLREDRFAMKDEDKIRIRKDGRELKGTFYHHIRTLFSLFLLVSEHRDIMTNMALIPYMGIPARLFAKWCGYTDMNGINDLIETGLINCSNWKNISLHPVIQEIGIADLRPSITRCGNMLRSIEMTCLRHGETIEYYGTLLETVTNIMIYAECDDAKYYLRFIEDVFPMMKEYGYDIGSMLALSEMTALLGDPGTGSIKDRAMLLDYKAVSERNPSKAVNLDKQTLEMLRGTEDEHHHFIANVHNNIALRYREMKQYEKAREHFEAAMGLLEQYSDIENHDTIVISLNYVALLTDLKQYDEAMRATYRIEQIIRSYETEPGMDYAQLLDKRGMIHYYKGEITEAKRIQVQVVDIYKRVFGMYAYDGLVQG